MIVKIVMMVCSTASNSSASLFYLSMTSNFLPTALLQWRRLALFCFCGKTSQHFNACIICTLNEGQKKDDRGFWEIRPKSLRFPTLLADCSDATVHSYTEKSSLGNRTRCQSSRCTFILGCYRQRFSHIKEELCITPLLRKSLPSPNNIMFIWNDAGLQ